MLWKGFSMNPNSWMENPALSGIDPAKLQLLTSLAGQAQGKSQNELLPFLMSAASGQLSFDPAEIDTIIRVLKIGKSPQETQRIDRMCALMKHFTRHKKKKLSGHKNQHKAGDVYTIVIYISCPFGLWHLSYLHFTRHLVLCAIEARELQQSTYLPRARCGSLPYNQQATQPSAQALPI